MLTADQIKTKMAQTLGINQSLLVDEALLQEVVAESFILIDMVIEVQNEFKIRLNQEDLANVRTVGQFINTVQTKSA